MKSIFILAVASCCAMASVGQAAIAADASELAGILTRGDVASLARLSGNIILEPKAGGGFNNLTAADVAARTKGCDVHTAQKSSNGDTDLVSLKCEQRPLSKPCYVEGLDFTMRPHGEFHVITIFHDQYRSVKCGAPTGPAPMVPIGH